MSTPNACPICGKPAEQLFRPFCSARCAEIDLGRWLTGQYRAPSSEEPAEDAAEPPLDRPRPMR